VKGELGLLIEDREIYFEPRWGVGSGFTDHRQSFLALSLVCSSDKSNPKIPSCLAHR
jgi:hypothetical protein